MGPTANTPLIYFWLKWPIWSSSALTAVNQTNWFFPPLIIVTIMLYRVQRQCSWFLPVAPKMMIRGYGRLSSAPAFLRTNVTKMAAKAAILALIETDGCGCPYQLLLATLASMWRAVLCTCSRLDNASRVQLCNSWYHQLCGVCTNILI